MPDILTTIAAVLAGFFGFVIFFFALPEFRRGCKLPQVDETFHGGLLVAETLFQHGVKFIFTLTGGHISPILVAAAKKGINIIDVRHEVTAVFAADAVSRLRGIPGVACVTAGPGLTNTVTAVQNAQLAQSPLILIGGAAATLTQGRGALQDVDQMSLFRPITKWSKSVRRVKDIVPSLQKAFQIASSGVPGPVFLEFPLDVLYPLHLVAKGYGIADSPGPTKKGGGNAFVQWYLRYHVSRIFAGCSSLMNLQLNVLAGPLLVHVPVASPTTVRRVAAKLANAERPVMVLGSQCLLRPFGPLDDVANVDPVTYVRDAVSALAVPTFLSGMARGLLGPAHPYLFRQKRREALRDADFVLLAGVPCDFRLDYGRHVSRKAYVVSVNLSHEDLRKNRGSFWRCDEAVLASPGKFLVSLWREAKGSADLRRARIDAWVGRLRRSDDEKAMDNARRAKESLGGLVNPLELCHVIDTCLGKTAEGDIAWGGADPAGDVDVPDVITSDVTVDDVTDGVLTFGDAIPDAIGPPGGPALPVLVADGGDFVATAAYITRPRGPLTWLDPGPFGTLGVGAGFALGAKLCCPDAEVWILYGDGSVGYSLSEFDTFVRHKVPVIAVVGNDACWSQIAREQVEMFGDDIGCNLARTNYHEVVQGFGAAGFCISHGGPEIAKTLSIARKEAKAGKPVLVNVLLERSDFRKGSISV